ncbi:MAG: C-type lectin domain-containing protein, partial [Myxococcales bacterium]|nr:C-type lectin domain-containing protein [Myxococcales bacterium]
KAEGDEECDGSDLREATCASKTGKDSAQGDLSCTDDCKLDSSQCIWCGDGELNGDEECDPNGFVAPECESKVGTVQCTSDCKLDTSDCKAPACNDMVKNGDETDLDCGGSCPLPCGNDQDCAGPADCNSATCSTGTCTDAATCTNDSNCNEGVCRGGRCFTPGSMYRTPQLTNNPCPQGWTPIGTHGCFLRPAGNKTWYEAFKDCRALGANLAILPSSPALNNVGKHPAGGNLSSTGSTQVWAGFACVNGGCSNKANWYWLDSTPVADHWGQQPPHVANQCGSLRYRQNGDIGTSANNCNDLRPYICQLLWLPGSVRLHHNKRKGLTVG